MPLVRRKVLGNDYIWKVHYICGKEDKVVEFDINPRTLSIELEQRVAVKQTLGGWETMAWNDKEGWSGYGRLILKLAGSVSLLEYKKKEEERKEEMGLVKNVLSRFGVGRGRERYVTAEILEKEKKMKEIVNEGFSGWEAIRKLYRYINGEWVCWNEGEKKWEEARWGLYVATKLWRSKDSKGKEGGIWFGDVKPMGAMVLSESADRANVCDWNVSFMVVDKMAVKSFMELRLVE